MDIQEKIQRAMESAKQPRTRTPGWICATLLAAGLGLPTIACRPDPGPTVLYQGPAAREAADSVDEPPAEPDVKGGQRQSPEQQPREPEPVPIYGVPH